jgi:hypothetical protein
LEKEKIQHEKARKDLKEQINKDKRIYQNAKIDEFMKLNSNPLQEEKSKSKLNRKKSKTIFEER